MRVGSLFFYFAFHLSPYVAIGLLYLLYVRPMRLKVLPALGLMLFLAACSVKSFWFRLFGSSAYYPTFNSEVLVDLFGIAYSFAMILTALSFLPPWRGRKRGVILFLLAALLAGWGSYEALRMPDVRTYDVPVVGLPPAFAGLTIAQVSDVHCSPAARQHYVQGVVARVNALKPDLICLTGDLVDGSPRARKQDLSPLADLRARLGVLGCTGNHEFYSNYALWHPIYTSWGIRMLDNAAVAFTNQNDVLVVGGVLDPVGAHPKKGQKRYPAPDVAAAFAHTPTNACRILLQHRPIDLTKNERLGVRLQLSGHTHGSPVWGSGPLIGAMNEGHTRGFYKEGNLTLYVTPGSGQWVGFPVRLGVPSEIALLRLVPAS